MWIADGNLEARSHCFQRQNLIASNIDELGGVGYVATEGDSPLDI